MEIVILGVEFMRRVLQRIGPYLLVELLLPGGSLLALALFLYRRRRPARLQKPVGDQVYGELSIGAAVVRLQAGPAQRRAVTIGAQH